MTFPESLPPKQEITFEENPLQGILEVHGGTLVLNHQGLPSPLRQAVIDCPPFEQALLAAASPEELQEIINALKAPK